MGVIQKIGGMRPAVFFDRDGVILKALVENGRPRPPYSRAEFEEMSGIVPGAREIIEAVRAAGFLAILATNQPDLHYGKITKADFDSIQGLVTALPFDDIFICFHGREEGCECKKPKPGMFYAAAKKWNINLTASFAVGDTGDDIGAATAVGCKSILVEAPYNTTLACDIRLPRLDCLIEHREVQSSAL